LLDVTRLLRRAGRVWTGADVYQRDYVMFGFDRWR